jgi:hypothetical protein
VQGKLSNLVERTRWAAEAPLAEAPLAEAPHAEAPPVGDLVDEAPPAEPRRLLPLAPRPFSQLARRDYRLYGLTLRGYSIALSAEPWYRTGRQRRPVHQQSPERWRKAWKQRLRRAYWHRVAEVMYWGEVA